MAIGQAYQQTAQDSKYIPTFRDADDEKGSKFNQDKQASNKLAFHGKGGNLSSRPQSGRNSNTPQLSSVRFQRNRRKK